MFFFQNKGCCVQPALPLLIPAAPSVVPAQVVCDCELNQIKALIQGKKIKTTQKTNRKRQKEKRKAAATAVKRDVRQVTAFPGLSEPVVAEQPGALRPAARTDSNDISACPTTGLQQNSISKSKIQVAELITMKHEHRVLRQSEMDRAWGQTFSLLQHFNCLVLRSTSAFHTGLPAVSEPSPPQGALPNSRIFRNRNPNADSPYEP